ncbi:MAG: Dehydrogenase, partial [Verrucomicrobiaceae bacterium]|nr:Dehydrogenase [Verrucomicrobiaceae bacterium]
CETGRNVVFGYQPKPEGAGWKMERFDFITSNTTGKFQGSDFVFVASGSKDISDERHIQFRPSDVTVGPDGAIYVCDWFDKRTGGHATLDDSCSGSVYRIAPKGFKSKVPVIDYSTTEGQIVALQSPAVNTRFVGFSKLKAQGAKIIPDLLALKSDNEYVAARKVWLLAQLGEAGIQVVTEMLDEGNPTTRLVAFRALKAAGVNPMTHASKLAKDTSAVVRRDLAASLRDAAADQAVPALVELAKGFDGCDRSYLAAWGIGCMGKEAAVWAELAKSMEWDDKLACLAWRLHPKDAIAPVKARALDAKLTPMQRKQAVDTLAFTRDIEAAKALIEVAKDKASPVLGDAMWWLINRSTNDWSSYGVQEMLKNEGILDPAKIKLTTVVSPEPPAADKIPAVADVLKLKGDAKNGATVAQRCFMCHQINGQGVDFGPGLTGWGATQPTDVITEAVLNPSKDIAHGFEGSSIVTKDGTRIDGMILTDGEFVMIKSMAGLTQIVPKSLIKSKTKMDRSLMLGAVQLGLTPQEVADVVAYLRTGK